MIAAVRDPRLSRARSRHARHAFKGCCGPPRWHPAGHGSAAVTSTTIPGRMPQTRTLSSRRESFAGLFRHLLSTSRGTALHTEVRERESALRDAAVARRLRSCTNPNEQRGRSQGLSRTKQTKNPARTWWKRAGLRGQSLRRGRVPSPPILRASVAQRKGRA